MHTGGLNLSLVSVYVSIDGGLLWDIQSLPNKATLGEDSGWPTSLTVSDLPAGHTYKFMVRAFNRLGNSSAACPPVVHDIGKHMSSYTCILNMIMCIGKENLKMSHYRESCGLS